MSSLMSCWLLLVALAISRRTLAISNSINEQKQQNTKHKPKKSISDDEETSDRALA